MLFMVGYKVKQAKVSNNVIRRLPRYLRKLDELKAAIESDADHARRILGCVRPQADVPLQGMNP